MLFSEVLELKNKTLVLLCNIKVKDFSRQSKNINEELETQLIKLYTGCATKQRIYHGDEETRYPIEHRKRISSSTHDQRANVLTEHNQLVHEGDAQRGSRSIFRKLHDFGDEKHSAHRDSLLLLRNRKAVGGGTQFSNHKKMLWIRNRSFRILFLIRNQPIDTHLEVMKPCQQHGKKSQANPCVPCGNPLHKVV